MIFYDKDGIVIRLIEKEDIKEVLDLYSKNTYNCTGMTGVLRPTLERLENIIRVSIDSELKKEAYLVMYKDDKFIGYLAMHIEFDKLVIGHTAVKKNEQHKRYGSMMTFVALKIADNEGRDVYCQCFNPKNYLIKIGFRDLGDGTYYKKTKHVDKKIPQIFMSQEQCQQDEENKFIEASNELKKVLTNNPEDFIRNRK